MYVQLPRYLKTIEKYLFHFSPAACSVLCAAQNVVNSRGARFVDTHLC